MAALIKKYNIGSNRIARGLMQGLCLYADGTLGSIKGAGRHSLFLGHLDSSERDCVWGRFVFDLKTENDAVLIVRAFASNELEFMRSGEVSSFDSFLLDANEPIANKEKLFAAMGASKFTDSSDLLLYEQKGRYLWLFIDIFGVVEVSLKNLRVYVPGDNFLNTFPEIYRKNGEFFHRYLSIFSSLYSDFQNTIDSLDKYIDIDTAPDQLLPVFAQWLGIELGGNFLDSEHLRRLLKSAYTLIRVKGTKQAVLGIVRLFVEEPFYVIEQRQLQKYSIGEARAVNEALYGKSPYEFTILINQPADEKLRSRLLFLLGQFKPVRSKVSIVFLGDCGSVDSYCYLDINARIVNATNGRLDSQAALSGMIFLQ